MRGWTLLALLAGGCGTGEIVVTPGEIAWGRIDFNQPLPDSGHDPRVVEIENVGTKALDIVLRDVDEEHILVSGRLAEADPPTLATLEPGASAALTFGVWAYLPGEWDTEVDGAVRFEASGLADGGVVEWSFTPVRDFGED